MGRRVRFGDGGRKTTPSVGDVLAYGEEYGGRSERGGKKIPKTDGVICFRILIFFYGRNGDLE